ncbi:ubiquinol-cytochrome C chaperone family protein [Jiella sp. M17.18]|uniref:ubiquinol-cytochrome C chaperone family protein n=1 Tax=Jiella sp. M17.18 TaxID=3234247 RepID=UPI0034DE5F7F
MLQRWRIRRRNRAVVDRIYDALVALTRQPDLYLACGIEDSFAGRFEALAIHVHLLLRRCRTEKALAPLAQEVVDRFVSDVEFTIRELGVGDQSVPKRMRRLTGVFYERAVAYDAAFAAPEEAEAALAKALTGRAVAETGAEDAARRLATYIVTTEQAFAAVSADDILTGRLSAENRS